MLTKPEHVVRAIENADKLLLEAWNGYTSTASNDRKEEAFEALVDACRKFSSIIEYLQKEIEHLKGRPGC